ncbi:MAG: carbamoyl-phosphate synthase domain-containing protein, partial [Cyanobacteria bacterium P01_A01_bin.84]
MKPTFRTPTVLEQESERPTISGIVVNEYAQLHSREPADASLQDYLEKHKVVGIADLDTR